MHLRELVVSYRRRRVLVECEPQRVETPSAAASVLGALIGEEPVAAGTLMGVPVLDHIIVGHDGRYYSFIESGAIT